MMIVIIMMMLVFETVSWCSKMVLLSVFRSSCCKLMRQAKNGCSYNAVAASVSSGYLGSQNGEMSRLKSRRSKTW